MNNEFVCSISKMKESALRIFSVAIASIDKENPPENVVYLSKEAVCSFDNETNHDLSNIGALMDFNFEVTSSNDSIKHKRMVLIPFYEFDEKGVKIEFNKHVMPYLMDLKDNFTHTDILNLAYLNSKYSVILYSWLVMNRSAKKLERLKKLEISVKELRELTNTEHEYKRFQHLETWVLKKPVEEINKHTQFNVTYDKIRSGRHVREILFRVEKQ